MKTRMKFFVNLSSVHGKAFSLKMTTTLGCDKNSFKQNKFSLLFRDLLVWFRAPLFLDKCREKKLPDKTVYQHFSLSQVELTSAEGSGNAVDIYCLFPLLVHCWRYCIPYEKQQTFYLDDVRRKINQIFYILPSSPFRVDTICPRHAKCEVSSVL